MVVFFKKKRYNSDFYFSSIFVKTAKSLLRTGGRSEASPVLCPVSVEAVVGVDSKVSPSLDDGPASAGALHVAKDLFVLPAHGGLVDASLGLPLLQNVVAGTDLKEHKS